MQDIVVLGGPYSGDRVEIIYYARRRRTRRRLQRSSSRDNLLCKTSSYSAAFTAVIESR